MSNSKFQTRKYACYYSRLRVQVLTENNITLTSIWHRAVWHIDTMHAGNRRLPTAEARIRTLQRFLVEKVVLERVFHKHFGFPSSVLTVPILHIYSPNIRSWYVGPFAVSVPREPLSPHPVNQDINKHQLFGKSCLFFLKVYCTENQWDTQGYKITKLFL